MNCYFCGKPSEPDGSTFHHPNCAGLARSDLNNLQVHDLEVIKRRYDDMARDPVGARHWLALLSAGKGTVKDFGKMMDRIHVSRENARTQSKTQEYGALTREIIGEVTHDE
jgi:hypothetical protein